MIRLTILCLLVSLASFGQLKRNVAVSLMFRANFGMHEFATQDMAGGGLHIETLLLAKKKLGITTEAGVDIFWGDKSLYVGGDEGNINSNPWIEAIRVGPHLFAGKSIKFAATYGIARTCFREYEFHVRQSLRLSTAFFLGPSKKWQAQVSYDRVIRQGRSPGFIGVSIGRRFY